MSRRQGEPSCMRRGSQYGRHKYHTTQEAHSVALYPSINSGRLGEGRSLDVHLNGPSHLPQKV